MKILIVTPAFGPPHGGLRVIFEWANRLSKWHEVHLFSLHPTRCNWFQIDPKVIVESNYRPFGMDCLIITSPHSIHLSERPDCPPKVFLFMQMLEHLFKPENNIVWQHKCRRFYRSPHPMILISRWNERVVKEQFGRTGPTYYVGNGVNLDDFPIERANKDGKTVLFEGWESHNLTKDSLRLAALTACRLKQEGYHTVAFSHLPLKSHSECLNEYHYQPSLEMLNSLYRRAVILVKASHCDARACAPMEAMTKGTVTARAITEGDDDLHDGNSIRVGYEGNGLYAAAKTLLTDPILRNKLAEECIHHVQRYNWDYWMPIINTIITGEKKKAKTVIVAVRYLEDSWKHTQTALEKSGAPIVYVDRDPAGIGSLAQAINRGFEEAKLLYDFEYVWFVTNVHVPDGTLRCLEVDIEAFGFAALHPEFDSDHDFCRPGLVGLVANVPFLEFTALMVRRDVFEKFPLDETMPFWGHDLDWGYRVRNELKGVLAVSHRCSVGHVYLRNSVPEPDSVTYRRSWRRKLSNQPTRARLVEKYGPAWKQMTGFKGT
jgi:hypothetical protein